MLIQEVGYYINLGISYRFHTFGVNIGKFCRGIRVRRYDNTMEKIKFSQAIIRYQVKILLGWISFLTINSNSKRRAIHDMASGTVMLLKN